MAATPIPATATAAGLGLGLGLVQGPSREGLGLFATRDFAVGDLVTEEKAHFLSHVRDAAQCGVSHEKHNDRFAWSLLERMLDGFSAPVTQAPELLASWTTAGYATCGVGHNWEEGDERALAYLITKSGLPRAVVRGLYSVLGTNAITASLTTLPLPLPPLDHASYASYARQKVELGSEQWPTMSVARTFGFFPRLARMNHSCAPNANLLFPPFDSNGPIEIRAIEHITAGSEVTYNYLGGAEYTFGDDAPVAQASMRAQLHAEYGFRCQCVQCVPLCSRLLCSSSGERKCPCELGVHYCGEHCQRLDWKRHREACKAARARVSDRM